MVKTIVNTVKKRIISHGQGWCFTPKHFLDLDNEDSVHKALSRLQKSNMIRRLAQGLYEYPRKHEVLGLLPPQVDKIAQAIAEKNGIQIQPSGAYAANIVGLSEQVPGKIVFLTNGPSKKVKIGKLEIVFKTAREKTLHASGKVGLVIQALKNLGKQHIDEIARSRVQRFLDGMNNSQELKKNLKYAPQWIRLLILEIVGENK